MRATLLCLGLALSIGAPAAAADPAGQYAVRGENPGGGGTYRGSVEVTRTGQTFRVVWVVGKDRFVGTGIGDETFVGVTYRSGNATGIALYAADGEDWKGVWTYDGGTQVGTERWVRQ